MCPLSKDVKAHWSFTWPVVSKPFLQRPLFVDRPCHVNTFPAITSLKFLFILKACNSYQTACLFQHFFFHSGKKIKIILKFKLICLAASPNCGYLWVDPFSTYHQDLVMDLSAEESSEFSLDGTVFLLAPAEATGHVLCMLGTIKKARLCHRNCTILPLRSHVPGYLETDRQEHCQIINHALYHLKILWLRWNCCKKQADIKMDRTVLRFLRVIDFNFSLGVSFLWGIFESRLHAACTAYFKVNLN